MKLGQIIIYVLLAIMSSNIVLAQVMTPNVLFNPNNPKIVGKTTNITYQGTPAVLIEPSQKKIPPTHNPAESIPPPQLTPKNINIPIRTPFGHDRTAAFVDHSTDFSFLIQILDNKKIQIEEQIQFVSTKEGRIFSRTFPKKITHPDGDTVSRETKITKALINNVPISLTQNETAELLTVTYEKPLPIGIHRFILSYVVETKTKQNQSISDILIDLTGTEWPLAIERFSALVLFPQKTTIYQKELLFGINNVSIPDNVLVQVDDTGSILYQLTRPLPAFADVRLHILTDSKSLPQAKLSFKDLSSAYVICVIFSIVLLLYTFASIFVCKHKKWQKPLTKAKSISPFLWKIGAGYSLPEQDIIEIKHILNQLNKKSWFIKCAEKAFQHVLSKHIFLILLKGAAFIRFNIEYIIGILLLIWATKWIAEYQDISLSNHLIAYFGLIGFLSVSLIHYFGTRIELNRFKTVLQETLLNTPLGLNLSVKAIPTYYILSLCLGFGHEWRDRLIQNNPNYIQLTFLRKETK